jgi:hypothetical protein
MANTIATVTKITVSAIEGNTVSFSVAPDCSQ